MVRGKRKVTNNRRSQASRKELAQCVGSILLDLGNALRKAERCRRALTASGYSKRRWQEIVKDVDPELWFMVRPNISDAIFTYLRSAREPVDKDDVVRDVGRQTSAPLQRIKQYITWNVQTNKLVLGNDGKISLPEMLHK